METESGEKIADRTPLSLFELSGAVVSSAMRHVEKEVWALPGPVLQGILPLLNIYYLERIEETAVKKGLSTQPIWCKLWFDIMKTRPSRLESIKCWRKRFLETFFSNVLRGILDVSSHQRLRDPCFLPLLHTSQHVTQLSIYNMLEGISELMAKHNQGVLENLAVSLRSLTFRHLLSSSLSSRQQLSLFLHRLIHHGAVNHLSMYSWPDPDPALLALILKMSAGVWHPGKSLLNQENLCHLCREKCVDQSQEHKPPWGSRQLFHRSAAAWHNNSDLRNEKLLPTVSQESLLGFENAVELARTSSKTLKVPIRCRLGSQNRMQHSSCSENYSAEEGPASFIPAKTVHDSPASEKRHTRDKAVTAKKRSCRWRTSKATTESDDLYDFVFAIARKKEEKPLRSKRRNAKEEKDHVSSSLFPPESASGSGIVCSEGTQSVGTTFLKTPGHFRSVSTLEVFSISLTMNTCQMLGNLLSSWVSLEKLVLSLNGLGPGIFSILSGLRALSHHNDYRLRVVRISDMFSHVPCMNLVHSFLSAVPLLQTLLVSFDLKTSTERGRPEKSLDSSSLEEEIPESHLEHLEIRFPREPLQTSLLIPVLKASRSLQSLSLDSVAVSCPQEVGLLLHALKEYSPSLKKLSFHDVNLSGHSKEVLFLLQDPILQGNHRLVALADIFSEDSSSSICHLDVSSNCIKPDGLLEFAKKLENYIAQRGEQIKFIKLCLYQNWLDQDTVTAQEALWRLKAMCSVVSDTWDSSQAFADYISVM
ncbi:leucine-rich repeat-containing protein 41 isoform X2 [Rhineura floridana]|uniref:leucine-rich repeat-containing protein 41 isoform X2 n=1 Tax=Rhineura floridana TaxID=261503 RepID=UPI002AC8257F|nr:leucine-rich repeat-containing protein 41 isoform X2 [Rhineura floridana]